MAVKKKETRGRKRITPSKQRKISAYSLEPKLAAKFRKAAKLAGWPSASYAVEVLMKRALRADALNLRILAKSELDFDGRDQ